MKVLKIDSFQDIVKRIGNDLAWYYVYRGISYAQDALHVEWDDLGTSDLQHSVFMYLMKHELNELASHHIYFTECRLSQEAFDEARDYFVLAHRCSTFQLSSYLNYLDEWTGAYESWVDEHPLPLHCLQMEKKD